MAEERIKILIAKHLSRTLTDTEKQELDNLINPHPGLPNLMQQIGDEATLDRMLQTMASIDMEANVSSTLDLIHHDQAVQKWIRIGTVFAAAVILLFVAGFYLLRPSQNTTPVAIQAQAAAVNSYPDNTVLILANKEQLSLDSLSPGPLPGANGIHKKENGLLVYTGPVEEGIHTFRTSNTETLKMVLPDGSTVWLNNGSTLRFSTTFTKTERKVWLTGEAYFGIVKNAHKPFRVETDGVLVDVLGTHFNIKAYNDEKEITTTLIEGKVTMRKGKEQYPLIPRDQCIFTREQKSGAADNKGVRLMHNIDTMIVVAWKANFWRFSGTPISTILRQLGRWHNVEFDFRAIDSTRTPSFDVPRTTPLEQLLKYMDLKSSREGKKITLTEEGSQGR